MTDQEIRLRVMRDDEFFQHLTKAVLGKDTTATSAGAKRRELALIFRAMTRNGRPAFLQEDAVACPKCATLAGTEDIEQVFGFRSVPRAGAKVRVRQSQCRKCRKAGALASYYSKKEDK